MKQNKEILKQFFETGDKPTQQQYADLIDSYVDAKQLAGEANRRFVIDETGEVSVASEVKLPEYTLSEIIGNKLSLLKDGVVVKEIDLTTYLDDTNLSRLVSGAVDPAGMATFKRDDNSTFTVDFSSLLGGSGTQVQADWNQGISSEKDFIKNAPRDLLRALEPGFQQIEYRSYGSELTTIDNGVFDKDIVTFYHVNNVVSKSYLFLKSTARSPYAYNVFNILRNSEKTILFKNYAEYINLERTDEVNKSGYIAFKIVGYNGGLFSTSTGVYTKKMSAFSILPIQGDWGQTDSTQADFIKNKPELKDQVQSDWKANAIFDPGYIKNKPPHVQLYDNWNNMTSAILNNHRPLSTNPIGTIIVNTNSSKLGEFYLRLSDTKWFKGQLTEI